MTRKHIFISSVQSEFAEERKRLAEYIRQDALFSRYFEPFLFEELPAQDMSAQGAYLEQAAKSEVYLLLAGERYGYQDAEGISPTEREYNTATSNHAYRIAFTFSWRYASLLTFRIGVPSNSLTLTPSFVSR